MRLSVFLGPRNRLAAWAVLFLGFLFFSVNTAAENPGGANKARRTRSTPNLADAAHVVVPTVTKTVPEPFHEEEPPPPDGEPPAASGIPCAGGRAAGHPCHDIDLLALMPRSALGAARNESVNDLWGWADPQTGREYALVGRAAGVSMVDVTAPTQPHLVGLLPTRFVASAWRDIKTIDHYMLVGADASPFHGLQIFDLQQLRGVSGAAPVFTPTVDYLGAGLGFGQGGLLGSSHNIAVNEESGFAYVLGSDTCAAGLHMVDLRNPLQPFFAGCFADDGYTHDAQCVNYRGPDAGFAGRELCFAANEDTITVVDVTDHANPTQISRVTYSGSAYTHQVWLTEDQRYLLVDDELDELNAGHPTRTRVFDYADVANPSLIGIYDAKTSATDHNMYVKDRFAYQANYKSGLRILSLEDVDQGRLSELAFFDTYPASDEPGFEGAWSVYPFLPSGNILVSSINEGLFVLRPRLDGHGHHD